jgi:PilZ domain-containing protein
MLTNSAPVHPRYPLSTTVVVREPKTGVGTLARLKNISLSGCYLETPQQIPEDARVRVVLQTTLIHADVWGIVRRRDANGIGIQFTNGATVDDWKRLEAFIQQLEATGPATPVPLAETSRKPKS